MKTSEVELVESYNNWLNAFLASGAPASIEFLKVGLEPYITDDTVLLEPSNIPWGGLSSGFAGWARFFSESAPVFAHFAGRFEVTEPTYYQLANVVVRETAVTIDGPKTGKTFGMGVIEKFTIENGRFSRVDAYYSDPAGQMDYFVVEGVFGA